MFDEQKSEKLANKFGTNCFACGLDNPKGLRMKFWKGADFLVSNLVLTADHCGWNNIIHGGIITTILDETMSWTVIHLLDCLVMTQTIQVDFKNPLYSGDEVTAEGRISEIVDNRTVRAEAKIENLSGTVCATGSAVFSRFSQKVGKKLGLVSNNQ